MELTQKMFVTALLTAVVTVANLGAVQGGDSSPVWKLMRPLYAINFDIGRKHVLSYFLGKSGLCDLTVMVTDRPGEDPKSDEIPPLHTERFTAAVGGGKSARFDTAEGTSLEYACAAGAQTMRVREVNQVAWTSPPAK
jgi:hypothetical protein